MTFFQNQPLHLLISPSETRTYQSNWKVIIMKSSFLDSRGKPSSPLLVICVDSSPVRVRVHPWGSRRCCGRSNDRTTGQIMCAQFSQLHRIRAQCSGLYRNCAYPSTLTPYHGWGARCSLRNLLQDSNPTPGHTGHNVFIRKLVFFWSFWLLFSADLFLVCRLRTCSVIAEYVIYHTIHEISYNVCSPILYTLNKQTLSPQMLSTDRTAIATMTGLNPLYLIILYYRWILLLLLLLLEHESTAQMIFSDIRDYHNFTGLMNWLVSISDQLARLISSEWGSRIELCSLHSRSQR